MHIHRHVRPHVAWRLGDAALDVGGAQHAGEIVEADAVIGVAELAGDPIGGRLGDGDAGQRIEQRHVRAGQLQLDIDAGEGERVLHRSHQPDVGGPVRQPERDRIGLALVAQRQQRAADQPAGDCLAGIGAVGIDHDLRVFRACGPVCGGGLRLCARRHRAGPGGHAGAGGDREPEIGAQLRIDEMDAAVLDRDLADLRRTTAAAEVQRVVVLAVRQRHRRHHGCGEIDVRDHDVAVVDVVHHADGDAEMLGGCEGVLIGGEAGRIGDRHPVGDDVRNAPELHVQMGDGDAAADGGGGAGIDERDEPVPVPQ